MVFRYLESVALDRNLPEHDLRKGDVGVVVHVYGDDALEVEFMRYSGDIPAVRRRGGSRG